MVMITLYAKQKETQMHLCNYILQLPYYQMAVSGHAHPCPHTIRVPDLQAGPRS